MSAYKLLSVVLLLASVAVSQPEGQHSLLLETKIAHTRYCDVPDDVLVLRLTFKANVTNSAEKTIAIGYPVFPLTLVSRTLGELNSHKYEFELHSPMPQPQLVGPEDRRRPEVKPAQQIIHPRESFEFTTMEVTLPVVNVAKDSRATTLKPGSHYVQIVLDAQIVGTKKSVRATSQPMEIRIKKNQKPEICQ